MQHASDLTRCMDLVVIEKVSSWIERVKLRCSFELTVGAKFTINRNDWFPGIKLPCTVTTSRHASSQNNLFEIHVQGAHHTRMLNSVAATTVMISSKQSCQIGNKLCMLCWKKHKSWTAGTRERLKIGM